MSIEKFVVALYDFRSKQKFIYRTNAVKEIMGASKILENAYKDFIKEYGKVKYDLQPKFSLKSFVDDNSFDGEVLYDGGGNLQVIFKSKEKCIYFNRRFSKWLVENTYSLSLVVSICYFEDNYAVCRKKLYEQNAINKKNRPPLMFSNVLPFTQIDKKTSQPITLKKDGESYSKESELKIKYYEEKIANNPEHKDYEKEFDKMGTKKGDESLLAVIYIDGNGLGNKIKNIIDEDMNFEDGINKMRKLSESIRKDFVADPLTAIKNKINKLNNEINNKANGKPNTKYSFRKIIGGGDEITIVCNARIALRLVKTYFDTLTSSNYGENQNSACAGIAIFHSHDPFSVVYKIAEECCESGKQRIRDNRQKFSDNCYIDYFFCHSGITNDIAKLRSVQEKNNTNLPYCYKGNDDKHSYEDYEKIKKMIVKISRSDVKKLKESTVRGDSYFKYDIERIKSKCKDFDIEASEKNKKIISDIATVYDIWFSESED